MFQKQKEAAQEPIKSDPLSIKENQTPEFAQVVGQEQKFTWHKCPCGYYDCAKAYRMFEDGTIAYYEPGDEVPKE